MAAQIGVEMPEVRCSDLVLKILEDPKSRHIFYKMAWNGGGKINIDGCTVEFASGDKFWYHNGKLHRLDGPAVDWSDGRKEWWMNGKLHRLDGPSLEWPDGAKEWYIEGVNYTEEQFKTKIAAMNRPCIDKKIVVEYTLA
jgi:hypothetical protein